MTTDACALAARLNASYDAAGWREWLADALAHKEFAPVQLSAFNPEDVILSAWLAQEFPAVPILCLDTLKHFPCTLDYVEKMRNRYGLKTLQFLYPDEEKLKKLDPKGDMWSMQVNRCCYLRKVEPLEKELEKRGYSCLIAGLRQEQTPERLDMAPASLDDKGRLKISPLFGWNKEKRDAYMHKKDVPHHPLYALGYPSMGCAPCTTPVYPGENERAGRWRHTKTSESSGKTECGLHAAATKKQ
ncbi:MAG: phosphoadenylyl-sulfate reductase [Rickettsiales bacterium]